MTARGLGSDAEAAKLGDDFFRCEPVYAQDLLSRGAALGYGDVGLGDAKLLSQKVANGFIGLAICWSCGDPDFQALIGFEADGVATGTGSYLDSDVAGGHASDYSPLCNRYGHAAG